MSEDLTLRQQALKEQLDRYSHLAEDIPPLVARGIRQYVIHRRLPGQFLVAVLSNNLAESFGRADYNSKAAMDSIVKYLWNAVPSACWGSPGSVRAWLRGDTDEEES